MPELPEVETTVRGLEAVLLGETLAEVSMMRPDLRWPMPLDLRQRLTGAHVTGLSRRAKYGLIATNRDDVMIFHLGMSGRWRINPDSIGKHDHLILRTGAGHILALCDPRRFGSVDLVAGDPLTGFAAFTRMGPEPLSDDFNAAYLATKLKGRASPIKSLLLDQRVVAGLGNIYVCEALNMAGISPLRLGGKIAAKRLEPVVAAIKSVLIQAIAAGGSTLRDFARPDGELGYFAKDWRVYGREGHACPCGGMVMRVVQSGRSSFYCPSCQK